MLESKSKHFKLAQNLKLKIDAKSKVKADEKINVKTNTKIDVRIQRQNLTRRLTQGLKSNADAETTEKTIVIFQHC